MREHYSYEPTAPTITHKQAKAESDQNWDQRRQQNRMHNTEIAHGFVHTSQGQQYIENGVARPKKKTKPVTIFQR